MIKHLLTLLHYEDVMISLTQGLLVWLSAHYNPIRAALLDLGVDNVSQPVPAGSLCQRSLIGHRAGSASQLACQLRSVIGV